MSNFKKILTPFRNMAIKFGYTSLKALALYSTCVVLLFGLVLIIQALRFQSKWIMLIDITDNSTRFISNWCLYLGLVIILLSIYGFCCILCNTWFMALSYFVLYITLVAVTVVSNWVLFNELKYNTMPVYRIRDQINRLDKEQLDHVQRMFKCCGIEKYTDYFMIWRMWGGLHNKSLDVDRFRNDPNTRWNFTQVHRSAYQVKIGAGPTAPMGPPPTTTTPQAKAKKIFDIQSKWKQYNYLSNLTRRRRARPGKEFVWYARGARSRDRSHHQRAYGKLMFAIDSKDYTKTSKFVGALYEANGTALTKLFSLLFGGNYDIYKANMPTMLKLWTTALTT